MKQVASKLQFIVGKRNGRYYKIFVNDLKSIKTKGQKARPKVPDFDDSKPSTPSTMEPEELSFAPF